VEHYAGLSIGGEIQHQHKTYSSPSAWSSFVKNRTDNGWTSITYQGVKLSQWRKITGITNKQFTTKKETKTKILSKSKNALCLKELQRGNSVRRAALLSGVSLMTAHKVKKYMSE
jgi:hypothetical protein